MKKFFVSALCVLYVVGVFFVGNLFYYAIPALNTLGASVAGITWPINFVCHFIGYDGCAVPPVEYGKYFFNFDQEFIDRKYGNND